MMRKIILALIAILALMPYNVFAAAYTSDVNTGLVRTSFASERYIVAINATAYYIIGTNTTSIFYRKSGNGGQTWSDNVTIYSTTNTDFGGSSVWYDRWTPGDVGTTIHIAYAIRTTSGTNSRIQYSSIDVSDDSISSAVTVASVNSNTPNSQVSITKARGGNLYIASQNSYGGAANQGFFRSTNSGSSWSARTSISPSVGSGGCGGTAGANKFCSLVPSTQTFTSNNIFACIANNGSVFECGFYDDSGNSWGFAQVGSANVRVGESISTNINSVGSVMITGSFVNGGNEDIKSFFLCAINCAAPTERTDILTGGTFSGTNTITRLTTTLSTTEGFRDTVIVSGRTATSGVEFASTTNFGGSWGSLKQFNKSNLSTQVINLSVVGNATISNGRVLPIWNYSSPNGAYFVNEAVASSLAAATPTPIAKIWFQNMVDQTTNNDSQWGQMIWMIIGAAFLIVLLVMAKAPPFMYFIVLVMTGIAYLSILYIPGEVAVIAVLLVGLILAFKIIKGNSNSEDKA